MTHMTAVADLWKLAQGYRVTQAIYVAAALGLSDQLADGPRELSCLADQTHTDPPSLYRLLRALATVGVYEELPDRHFGLTALGEALRSDVPDSMAPLAKHLGSGHHQAAWGGLLESIRTGTNAFTNVHGMSVWDYQAARPDDNAVFNAAMTSISQRVAGGVLEAYDFARFGTVVDVAGGRGALLGAILARYPHLRGVLADQAHVIDGAPAVLTSLGVQDRCELVVADFFVSVPDGGDAYLLKSIVHDWEDPETVAILRTVRRAMSPTAVVLLIERLLGEPDDLGFAAAFSDLNMLVGPGGRERTEAEFEEVLSAAGLRRSRTVRTPTGFAVLEAVVDEGAGEPSP
jgi:O-methyltransferase domain/Dimerisation domain